MRHRKKRQSGRRPTALRCAPHNKEAFRSRTAAVNALAGYATKQSGPNKGHYPRRVYPDSCGYWHLTSSL